MSIFEGLLWIAFAGICYRLREFEIWADNARFTWMRYSDWWMNRTTGSYPWWTFKITNDAYHFFGNLARISISVRIGFEDWSFGILMFAAWFLGEYITLKLIAK